MQLTQQLKLDTAKKLLISANNTELDSPEVELSYAETAVLECLILHRDNLVSKEQLMQVGWPDRIVAQSSLQQCISLLRRKLASSPEIELKTVPRHGYVLHLPIIAPPRKHRKPLMAGVAALIFLAHLIGITWWSPWVEAISDPAAPYQQQQQTIALDNLHGHVEVFTPETETSQPTQSRLTQRFNQQIINEDKWQPPFNTFHSFAAVTSSADSFAICPNYSNGQCPGKQLINITGDPSQGAELALSDFLSTKIRMEQKTYNKLLLPELEEHRGDLQEDVYHGDLYFGAKGSLLVRSDFRISLVNLGDDQGLIYFAACITDENCHTSPMRYVIRGDFTQSTHDWQGKKVEQFDVIITKTELASPNSLSETAKKLYLKLRKQHLTQTELRFYRLYQDDGTAVWLVPMGEHKMVWMQKLTLFL
ncbi:helix-turn-helix domain-containing protein [Shewanella sp. UCD-KL12]|uniref:winged helix-turn-helix domain-containing protein n=1 Tax=Shewanella sp. UCD-KL12 TaxID=1917163 RepID=UPI000970EF9D|nr:helix-turn-helix domain-containing protein [Shewanella sp. UCD-KL12]